MTNKATELNANYIATNEIQQEVIPGLCARLEKITQDPQAFEVFDLPQKERFKLISLKNQWSK